MDFMTPLGYLIGFGAVLYVLFQADTLSIFLNWHAIILVFGGTFGATLVTYPSELFLRALRSLGTFLLPGRRESPGSAIERLVDLAERSRRDGPAGLEEGAARTSDRFFADALRMVLAGLPALEISNSLMREIQFSRRRHQQTANVFRSMATYAPIFGLLGTLVGVVEVLRYLTDPKSMGASMAVAMTATFYGIFAANFIFLPIAGKLTAYSDLETLCREIIVEGVLAIQRRETPARVARKLKGYLQAGQRRYLQTAARGQPSPATP